MSSPAERALLIILIGIAAAVLVLQAGGDRPRTEPAGLEATGTVATTATRSGDSTRKPVAFPATTGVPPGGVPTSEIRSSTYIPVTPATPGAPTITGPTPPVAGTATSSGFTITATGAPQENAGTRHRDRLASTTTVTVAETPTTTPGEPAPRPSSTTGATTSPTTTRPPSTTTAGTSVQPEVARSCPTVQELWEADGYPVEDPCTLAEVKRAFSWAWTGTDQQRRSAIRNGHLLDEVFAELDEYGRTYDAGLFDPQTRSDWTIVFDDILWRGGPGYDRAVIAVTYGVVNRDYPDSPRWTSTLVQVDGEWKVSYRRSYCLHADVILEYMGSDVRCPPDPHPEVHEDEDQVIIREYEE